MVGSDAPSARQSRVAVVAQACGRHVASTTRRWRAERSSVVRPLSAMDQPARTRSDLGARRSHTRRHRIVVASDTVERNAGVPETRHSRPLLLLRRSGNECRRVPRVSKHHSLSCNTKSSHRRSTCTPCSSTNRRHRLNVPGASTGTPGPSNSAACCQHSERRVRRKSDSGVSVRAARDLRPPFGTGRLR
jgi:hypothetical protein